MIRPIYVEVSAHDSDDREAEYRDYVAELARWNKVLLRGDYFLCASETQKIFYTGVLSVLGRINPLTYGQDVIHVVPYGIPDSHRVRRLVRSHAAGGRRLRRPVVGGLIPGSTSVS